MSSVSSRMFQPFSFANGITLRNRVVMAPMTTWSGNPDGTVSDQELAYYRERVKDVGMVLTGCTHVMENGIGFSNEFAAYDDRFIPSLAQLAQAAKSGGAPAILQIFHAGNKAIPELIDNGTIVSASAMKAAAGPFNSGEVVSHALTHDEIIEVIHAFGAATRRAIDAGFDGVELHGAHGFLIQNFFSPLFNQRTDMWGGSLENRMRFPLAIVNEVRQVIDTHANKPFLLGYRISPEESATGGLRLQDTLELIERLIQSDIDFIHGSLTHILEATPVGDSSGQLTARLIIDKVANRVPLIAAGHIRTPAHTETALALGLPLVAIGKGLVMNPDWVALAQQQQPEKIDLSLNRNKVPHISIPDKLMDTIVAAKGSGWFPMHDD